MMFAFHGLLVNVTFIHISFHWITHLYDFHNCGGLSGEGLGGVEVDGPYTDQSVTL